MTRAKLTDPDSTKTTTKKISKQVGGGGKFSINPDSKKKIKKKKKSKKVDSTKTKTKKKNILLPTSDKLSSSPDSNKKMIFPVLKRCNNNETSLNNKSRTYTIVVKKQTVTTVTLTSTITLLPGEKVDQDVCLYVCLDDSTPTFTWYKIDPNANPDVDNVSPQILTPISQMPKSTNKGFQVVASDSQIYALGGSGSDKVFVCDTTVTPSIWKVCPSMESPRESPAVAAVGGCIYAIGSLNASVDEMDPWAEVFDPSSQTWTTLPPPSVDSFSLSNSMFAKRRGDIIIVSSSHGDCVAHAFDCKTHSWMDIPISGPYRHCPASNLARSVVDGNTVYTFQNRMLYAWDLSQSEPHINKVNGLEEEVKKISHCDGLVVHLVNIGRGRLCLVWHDISNETENVIYIYCLKFWVGTSTDDNQLLAVVDRCDTYIANGNTITNCLTI